MPSMEDQEWAVLQALKEQDTAGNQREIAHGAGLSLGLTNAILKQLIKKGFLIVRKINGRNLSYALTPIGLEAYTKKTYRFIRHTFRNVIRYKNRLQEIISTVDTNVHLVGLSDLAFVIEYLCQKKGIIYTQGDYFQEGSLNFFSELHEDEKILPGVSLRELLTETGLETN